jgi:hypothetical protein
LCFSGGIVRVLRAAGGDRKADNTQNEQNLDARDHSKGMVEGCSAAGFAILHQFMLLCHKLLVNSSNLKIIPVSSVGSRDTNTSWGLPSKKLAPGQFQRLSSSDIVSPG